MRANLPVIFFCVALGVFGIAGAVAYKLMNGAVSPRAVATSKPTTKKKVKKPQPKVEAEEEQGDEEQPSEVRPKKRRAPVVAGDPIVDGQPVHRDRPQPKAQPPRNERSTGVHTYNGSSFAKGSLAQVRALTDNLTYEAATDRVGWEIVDAVEDRPTLAIWLFDRTPSAASLRSNVSQRLREVLRGFDELKQEGHEGFQDQGKGPPLLTAIAAFGSTCDILTPEPTDDTAALNKALDEIKEESDGSEMTFTAIQTVLDEFLKYRTEKHRLIVMTIITDEMGDDADKVDDLVPKFEKYAIPAYVIGVPAPFGREGSLSASSFGEQGKPPRIGPESMAKEMIALDFRGMVGTSEEIDSGFGPFALSRLAKVSGGAFLAVRSGNSGGGRFNSFGARRFESKIMAKYAPDYVSKKEYEALLAENKCRMALHNAAMVPPVEVNNGVNMQMSFSRQDEAALKRTCDMAQQSVARVDPKLRPLYAALAPGESDRSKLTGPRWQAAYDLAMGRVLAARARFDGYNTMVAQLKQGKRPGQPTDNVWTMMPAATFSTDSAIDKMVKSSRKYLERMVKEHPGTPWEMMATRELGNTCGWEWTAR